MSVKDWFDNKCPYEQGVQLYAILPGCNPTLLKNFTKRQSPQLYEKLKYELKKKLNDAPVVKQNEVQTIQTVEKEEINPISNALQMSSKKEPVYFHQLPEELRPVLLDANNHFREMCLLKVQLNELPGHKEKEALSIQLQINALQKKNALCWKKIDYYQEHKQMLQEKEKEAINLSPAKLLQKEQYLFSSISRLKKRLKENKQLQKVANSIKECNSLSRKIAKQHANILNKETELQHVKELINAK